MTRLFSMACSAGTFLLLLLSVPGEGASKPSIPGAGEAAPLAGTRYLNEVFPAYQVLSNVMYGQASATSLFLDIYTPTGDTVQNRPLAIFIHAGGFQNGDKTTPFAKIVCSGMARRGYVAASINYRLTPTITDNPTRFEAMLRARQDARAAVRFFRKNGASYGIDTSQIFAVGSSAGAITAIHMAYLDSAEVPPFVNWTNVGNSFEGTSGNPGYSSRVQGVVANWGAIGDTAWLKQGGPPIFCVHGTADSLIYYNLVPAYGPFLYSSKYIVMAAQQKGIVNGLKLFLGAGHELNGDSTKLDSAYNVFSGWLYTILKTTTTSVREAATPLPSSVRLLQNYPNPFNPSTRIPYTLPARMQVLLEVYNTLGQRVATLVDRPEDAGAHEVPFSAGHLPSGLYFYRFRSAGVDVTQKMLLAK